MFKKIGDGCGGFIAVDEYIAFFMELQWARILVKLEGKELPSSQEIVVGSGCFAIQLWWETHPSFVRVVLASKNCMAGSSRVREAIEEKPRIDYCGDLRKGWCWLRYKGEYKTCRCMRGGKKELVPILLLLLLLPLFL